MEVRERAFQDEQIVQLAQNSERLCTRLAEDAFTQIDDMKLKLSQAYASQGSKFGGVKAMTDTVNSDINFE